MQKGGPLLVFISSRGIVADVHLLDRTQPRRKTRNLTKGLFDGISDVAISKNGDVAFTTAFLEPPEARGIYLIPHPELQRNLSAAILLKHVSASNVEWAPNGQEIAYATGSEVFLLNPFTDRSLRVSKEDTVPAFSPNGQNIAVAHAFWPAPRENHLSILSLATLRPVAHIKAKDIPEDAVGGGCPGPRMDDISFTQPSPRISNHFGIPLCLSPGEPRHGYLRNCLGAACESSIGQTRRTLLNR